MSKDFYCTVLLSLTGVAITAIYFLFLLFKEKSKTKPAEFARKTTMVVTGLFLLLFILQVVVLIATETAAISNFWSFKLIQVPAALVFLSILLFTWLSLRTRDLKKFFMFMLLDLIACTFWFEVYFFIYFSAKLFHQ